MKAIHVAYINQSIRSPLVSTARAPCLLVGLTLLYDVSISVRTAPGRLSCDLHRPHFYLAAAQPRLKDNEQVFLAT